MMLPATTRSSCLKYIHTNISIYVGTGTWYINTLNDLYPKTSAGNTRHIAASATFVAQTWQYPMGSRIYPKHREIPIELETVVSTTTEFYASLLFHICIRGQFLRRSRVGSFIQYSELILYVWPQFTIGSLEIKIFASLLLRLLTGRSKKSEVPFVTWSDDHYWLR